MCYKVSHTVRIETRYPLWLCKFGSDYLELIQWVELEPTNQGRPGKLTLRQRDSTLQLICSQSTDLEPLLQWILGVPSSEFDLCQSLGKPSTKLIQFVIFMKWTFFLTVNFK